MGNKHFLNRLLLGFFIAFIVEYDFKVVVDREYYLFIPKEIIFPIPTIIANINHIKNKMLRPYVAIYALCCL